MTRNGSIALRGEEILMKNPRRKQIKLKGMLRITPILLLSTIGLVSLGHRAIAQEDSSESEYVPPYCEPAIESGFARCNYDDGANYIGYLEGGVPSGRGTYTSAEGRYEGEFLNGRPSGQGRYILSDDPDTKVSSKMG